jgi:hypothetical protein
MVRFGSRRRGGGDPAAFLNGRHEDQLDEMVQAIAWR